LAAVAPEVPKFTLQLAVHASNADALKGEFELIDANPNHRCHFVANRKLLYDENEEDAQGGNEDQEDGVKDEPKGEEGVQPDGEAEGRPEEREQNEEDDEWEMEWLEGEEKESERGSYDEGEGHYWENWEDLQARPWRVRVDVNCY
jgi:hypothetical protein